MARLPRADVSNQPGDILLKNAKHAIAVLTFSTLVLLTCLCLRAEAKTAKAAPGTVFVKTALGGFILGYNIDQNGTETACVWLRGEGQSTICQSAAV